MTNPAIKECSNPDCSNTWRVRNREDARRETCVPCHIETIVQAASTDPALRKMYTEHLHRMTEKLEAIERSRVYNLGREAARTAAIMDPRLHPNVKERSDPLECIPDELLGAARDLVDYLGVDRVPPETNRHGIPHAIDWDIGHAMHLVRDMALHLDAAQQEIPEYTRIRGLQELLNLAIEMALISKDTRNHPVLDELVAGSIADPKN